MDNFEMHNDGAAIRERRPGLKLISEQIARRTGHSGRMFSLEVLELCWECLIAGQPGLEKSKFGRSMNKRTQSLVQQLKAERNGHSRDKVAKSSKRKANKSQVVA